MHFRSGSNFHVNERIGEFFSLGLRRNFLAGGLVNLDALIPRADLAYDAQHPPRSDSFAALRASDLLRGSSMIFRKPDFQRETAHWSPEKVRDLVIAFASEDLVPSVILWRST